jgi:hypothetical protein
MKNKSFFSGMVLLDAGQWEGRAFWMCHKLDFGKGILRLHPVQLPSPAGIHLEQF